MSLFISNFNKYKHVYWLCLFIIAGIVCMATVNVITYCIRMKNKASMPEEQLFDDFFARKCLPNSYPVIFYGDSRTYNCISPAVVSELLHQPSFNMAFSSGGMNENMMKFLDSRIDRKKSKPVIVLGITPYSLTENARKNECYNTYSEKLKTNGQSMFISPEGPGVLDIIFMPLQKIVASGSAREGKIYRHKTFSKRYHDDGWVETVVYGDTSKSIKKTLEMYETRDFQGNPVSSRSIEEMLNWIRKWSNDGIQVFAFRPPTCAAMEELEERKTNFSSLLLADKIRECGGIWIDCSDSDLFSYDASHLDAESAVKLSQSIAETILKYLH